MTQEELDKKGAELLKAFDEVFSEYPTDPRFKNDSQILRAAAMIAIDLVADIKKIHEQFELLNKGICALVDLHAASYQNGMIVKIANPLELNIEGQDDTAEDKEQGDEENSYYTDEETEAPKKE